MRARHLTCALLAVTVLLCVACRALEADKGDEQVLISSRILPQSRNVASTSVYLGGWLHGGSREEDAAFFAEEDAQHRAWLAYKAQLLRRQQQQAQSAGTPSGQTRPSTPDAGVSPHDSWLTASAVARRAVERVRALYNVNVSTPMFVAQLAADSAALRAAVFALPARPSATSQETPSSLYTWLITDCFAHAVYNYSAKDAEDKRVAPFGGVALFEVLPYPMLLTRGDLTAAEAELRSLEKALAALPERGVAKSGNVTANTTNTLAANASDVAVSAARRTIAEDLQLVRRITTHSRRAARVVHAMAAPLLPLALQQLAAAQHEVQAGIVANDESTSALRRELKQMLKHKARLQAWEQRLRAAEEVLRRPPSITAREGDAVAMGDTPLLLQQDGSALTTGLLLMARMRLGVATGVRALDAQPLPALVPMLTGHLETEWLREFVRPLFRATVVTVVLEIALLEAKFGLVRRVAARRGGVVPARYKAAVAAVALLEVILPQGLAVLTLWWRSRVAAAPTLDKIACVRPPQRTTLIATLLVFNLVTTLLVTKLRTWRHTRGIGPRTLKQD